MPSLFPNATVWDLVLYTLILTHLTIITVTVYLHRCKAHRALDMHPALEHAFRFWAWLTTGMNTKEWTAVHRLHHAKCEKAGDPHSPQVHGLKKVFFKGYWLYAEAAKNKETLERYGKGTPEDWIERNLYSKHPILGIFSMLVINAVLFGPAGALVWLVQMLWIPTWAAGVINGVAHFWGYRNFDSKDASRNISPIGLLIGGEELHNNHHTYPASAKLSVKRFEFDIGWAYIRTFELFGLATVKKLPPRLGRKPLESIDDIIALRFEILSSYAKALKKIYKEEKLKLNNELVSVKRSTWKKLEMLEFSPKEQLKLEKLLENSPKLRKAFSLREELIKTWKESFSSKEQSMEHFKKWLEELKNCEIEQLRHLKILKNLNSAAYA